MKLQIKGYLELEPEVLEDFLQTFKRKKIVECEGQKIFRSTWVGKLRNYTVAINMWNELVSLRFVHVKD